MAESVSARVPRCTFLLGRVRVRVRVRVREGAEEDSVAEEEEGGAGACYGTDGDA